MPDPDTDPNLVDREIAGLLRERFQRAMIIGVAKAFQGLPVQNEEQEDSVIARALDVNRRLRPPLSEDRVGAIIREIMDCAVDLQEQLRAHWPADGFDEPNAEASENTLNEQRERIADLNDRIIRLIHARLTRSPAPIVIPPDAGLWTNYLARINRAIQSAG